MISEKCQGTRISEPGVGVPRISEPGVSVFAAHYPY